MSQVKRYYWLKMESNFLEQKSIKALRKTAGGATYVLIYIEMLLLSIPTSGVLSYDGIYGSFEEELALVLGEDVQDVRVVCEYLRKVGLLTDYLDNTGYVLPDTIKRLGSKTNSALRMERNRKRKLASQCDASSIEASQCDARDKRIENRDRDRDVDDIYVLSPSRPTLSEVQQYVAARQNKIDAEQFFEYYEGTGWTTKNGDPIVSWKSAVISWENHEKTIKPPKSHQPSFDSQAYERKGRNGPPKYKKG